MSKPFIFNLTPEEKYYLEQAAARRGMSVEEFVNVALAEALLENQTDAWHLVSLEDMAQELDVDLGEFVLYPEDQIAGEQGE